MNGHPPGSISIQLAAAGRPSDAFNNFYRSDVAAHFLFANVVLDCGKWPHGTCVNVRVGVVPGSIRDTGRSTAPTREVPVAVPNSHPYQYRVMV